MLTQLQFQVLDDGRGVGNVETLADAKREIEQTRREIYELKKYIAEHFGRLNNPGVLNITQTKLQNCAIEDTSVTDLTADLLPAADGTYDLGSTTQEWQDLWVDGTANIDSLVADTADINGGTVDGATVGANSASTGAFTTLNVSSTCTLSSGANAANDIYATNAGASGASGGKSFFAGQNDGAAMASGDRLGVFGYRGAYDSSNNYRFSSLISSFCEENWSSTVSGSEIRFETTAPGGNTRSAKFFVHGIGNVVSGSKAALATTATDGFFYVPTCAGTPTGVPTAYTGKSPVVVDTTNNKLYFYSGGAWRDAGP